MGLAQAFAIGIFPLLQAYFMPAVIRVTHSAEITANAFAFSAIVGVLFIGSRTAAQGQHKLQQINPGGETYTCT
jgi:hypothetical protein